MSRHSEKLVVELFEMIFDAWGQRRRRKRREAQRAAWGKAQAARTAALRATPVCGETNTGAGKPGGTS